LDKKGKLNCDSAPAHRFMRRGISANSGRAEW
jgi:hypothetical protein